MLNLREWQSGHFYLGDKEKDFNFLFLLVFLQIIVY